MLGTIPVAIYLHGSPATHLVGRNGYTEQENPTCCSRKSLGVNSIFIGKSRCLVLRTKTIQIFESSGSTYQVVGKDDEGGNSNSSTVCTLTPAPDRMT